MSKIFLLPEMAYIFNCTKDLKIFQWMTLMLYMNGIATVTKAFFLFFYYYPFLIIKKTEMKIEHTHLMRSVMEKA